MNPNIRDSEGKTPLYCAVECGFKDCVKTLLKCGADPELPVMGDDKAVHLAARMNKKNILKVLLECGAKSEEKNSEGETPINIALFKDYLCILRVLLDHKVCFTRTDEENNNSMHIIAVNNSYKCADFLLRDEEVEMAVEQLKAENVDGKSPIAVATMRENKAVLTTFIEKVPIDYFDEKAKLFHQFLEEEQFDILEIIFNRMCEKTNGGTEVPCRALMLDTNGKGQSPFSKEFNQWLPSLLHKLADCKDKELREHPIVKKTVERKLNCYRIWFMLSFLLYVVFLVVFSVVLFLASYECENDSWSHERILCEFSSFVFVLLLTLSQVITLINGWLQIAETNCFELKRRKEIERTRRSMHTEEGEKASDQTNCFTLMLKLRRKILKEIIPKCNSVLCYVPQGILNYIYNNPSELLGIVSYYLYFAIRISLPNISWLFGSLSFIGFTISSLKYTQFIPSLGAYIATVNAVFRKDIPRFLVLYVIVLIAYMGGIHLAARFVPPEKHEIMSFNPNGTQSKNVCESDLRQLTFFDEDLTNNYTLLFPFVDGMLLLIGGGAAGKEHQIFRMNLYFAVIYLIFSFTITVVFSAMLIAQLARTYAGLSAQGTFYYEMKLVIAMERDSALAFFLGKYFRQFSSMKSFNVSIDEWKNLRNDSSDANINKQLKNMLLNQNKNSADVCEGNEKIISQSEALDRLGEKVTKMLEKLDYLQMHVPAVPKKEDFALVSIDERMNGLEQKLNTIIQLLK